ncbi:Co-chaperone Hsc20 [Teratosphaeria nubilosa]|uniref:Co-chaperone Hsc20 n=1 Tax=Teratosphaeria nubilosa TaxID=161662 RepID=A0A6G1LD15_9PEZI|nr:Co-chaperone Hsc20 [Teratosphaeria nubilosa]
MRREAVQTARSALRLAKPLAQISPAPWVCASCRAAATKSSGYIRTSATRTFTTATPRRQEVDSRTGQRDEPPAAAPTHYDFFPQTFPSGPPPKSPFSPDLKQLRKEFLQLQAKAHPDLAPDNQKRQAEALSARINEAYKALQDPLKRAQYLLSLQGIDVEDESAKMSGGELLMQVMEAREAVDEVESEADLVGLREENEGRIAESVVVLGKAFAEGDLVQAASEAVRLRYWVNIGESIQGWEKGVGGGVNHH